MRACTQRVARFYRAGTSLHRRHKFAAACLPARPPLPGLQLPIGEEEEFKGMVDLVKMKALIWNGEVGARGCGAG